MSIGINAVIKERNIGGEGTNHELDNRMCYFLNEVRNLLDKYDIDIDKIGICLNHDCFADGMDEPELISRNLGMSLKGRTEGSFKGLKVKSQTVNGNKGYDIKEEVK